MHQRPWHQSVSSHQPALLASRLRWHLGRLNSHRVVLAAVVAVLGATVVLAAGGLGLLLSVLGFLFMQIGAISVPVLLAGIAIWVMRPLDRAARNVEAPVQFTLIDFLCLFFLVQMPMALIHGLFTESEQPQRWIFDIYAWFAFGAIWLASAQRLSRAGIHRPGQRALFLMFVVPSAVFGTVLGPLLCGLLIWAIVQQEYRYLGLATTGQFLLLVLVYISGRITRRMVARAAENHVIASARPG